MHANFAHEYNMKFMGDIFCIYMSTIYNSCTYVTYNITYFSVSKSVAYPKFYQRSEEEIKEDNSIGT